MGPLDEEAEVVLELVIELVPELVVDATPLELLELLSVEDVDRGLLGKDDVVLELLKP